MGVISPMRCIINGLVMVLLGAAETMGQRALTMVP
jgi:hypothetical protein